METIDCPLNKCLIKPEFMVSVPERLAQAITPEEQFRSLTEYVRNDIINRSLDTKHQMTRADPNKLRSATARVFPVFAAHQVYFLQEFFKGKIPADRVPEISLTPARILSGTMVALDAGVQGEPGAANVSAVLTAFRLHKAHDTACVALYFLIGSKYSFSLFCFVFFFLLYLTFFVFVRIKLMRAGFIWRSMLTNQHCPVGTRRILCPMHPY